jgi:hypothetical protein
MTLKALCNSKLMDFALYFKAFIKKYFLSSLEWVYATPGIYPGPGRISRIKNKF